MCFFASFGSSKISCPQTETTRYNVHRGRFARTVRTEETVYSAAFDRKAYVIDGNMIPVFFDEIFDFYQK